MGIGFGDALPAVMATGAAPGTGMVDAFGGQAAIPHAAGTHIADGRTVRPVRERDDDNHSMNPTQQQQPPRAGAAGGGPPPPNQSSMCAGTTGGGPPPPPQGPDGPSTDPSGFGPPGLNQIESRDFTFNINDLQFRNDKIPNAIGTFNAHTRYKAWRERLEDHLCTVNAGWPEILKAVRDHERPITQSTYTNTNVHLGLTGAQWKQLSRDMLTFLGSTLSEQLVESRDVMAGGESEHRNLFEIWRKLYELHGRQSATSRRRGLRHFKSFPRCKHMTQLNLQLGKWTLYLERYGQILQDEMGLDILLEFVPKDIEDKRAEENVASTQKAIDDVENKLAKLYLERCADDEERDISKQMGRTKPQANYALPI